MMNKIVRMALAQHMKEKELVQKLKDKPVTKSEYKQLMLDLDIEPKERVKFLNQTETLERNGCIIPDPVQSWGDFQKEAESKGLYPIKTSIYKQMSKEQAGSFHKKKFALFPDIKADSKVIHYEYKDTTGYPRKTGNGQGVRHLQTDDKKVVQEACKSYESAQSEIKKVLTDIEVRGNKFEDYLK